MRASDCAGTIPGKTLIPLRYELAGDLTRVFEINSSSRYVTCSIQLENLAPEKDSKVSVSVGAISFVMIITYMSEFLRVSISLNMIEKIA